MPHVKSLLEKLESLEYEVDGDVTAERTLYCTIQGGALGGVSAVLKANEHICNAGIVVGLFELINPRKRYILMQDLLELNFDHPLARIGLFHSLRHKDGEPANEPPIARIIVAESSFYWEEINKDRIDGRMKSLCEIAWKASEFLHARDALPSFNPFYNKLSGPKGPVSRSDLPATRLGDEVTDPGQ